MAHSQHPSTRRQPRVSNKDKLSPRQAKKLKRADRLIQEGGALNQVERLLTDIEQRLRPPYPLPLLQVQGALQFARQRYVEAQRTFKAIWHRDKRNPIAYFYLGRIYRKLNAPEAGRGLLETGTLLNPDHQPTRIEFIKTLLDLSELERANQEVEQQRARLPANPSVLHMAGLVKQRNHQLPDAVAFFRQALEHQIQQPPPHDNSAADADATFDVKRHEDTLWELLAQLKNAEVHAFPVFGTLLGLVRDGQLIGFDKDVDICVPDDQLDIAVACMEAAGWKEVANSFGMVAPRAFSHPQKGLAVDLFTHRHDPDRQAQVTGFIMPHIPWEWNFLIAFPSLDVQRTQRPHGEVWELKNPEAFLEVQYGPGWREADPYFASFAGEPGLIHFSYLTQCYAYIRLRKYWNEGSFKKADALLYHMLRHQPGDELLENAQHVVKGHLAKEIERQDADDLMNEKDDATVH